MILKSDTLNYRPDGTVSGVTRVVTETYTTSSGRNGSEDISSVVTLAEVTAGLDAAYAQFDAHNKALEDQIVAEREAAAADKRAALASAAQSANAATSDALAKMAAMYDGVVADLRNQIAAMEAKAAPEVVAQ